MANLKLKCTGLKSNDLDIEIPPRLLLLGRNGSGKSTAAQAITIAVLGYDPELGKTPAATAQLMRGRQMTITVTLPDGRWFSRQFKMLGEGKYETATRTSWITSSKSDEHHQEIIKLFGVDEHEAAQNLTIKELQKLSAPQRAATLLQLIEAGVDPKVIMGRVSRQWLVLLAGLTGDAGLPEERVEFLKRIRPMIDGYADDGGSHTGQYAIVVDATPKLLGKLIGDGIGSAHTWAREETTAAQAALREKNAARGDHESRLQELGEIDADKVALLEADRSELERAIGAAGQRQTAAAGQVQVIADARAEKDRAEEALRLATDVWAAAEKKRPEIDAKRTMLAGVVKALDELQPPSPPPAIATAQELVVARGRLQSMQSEIDAVLIPQQPSYESVTKLEELARLSEEAGNLLVVSPTTSKLVQRVLSLEAESVALTAQRDQADQSPLRKLVTDLALFRDEHRKLKVPSSVRVFVDAFCDTHHLKLMALMGEDSSAAISQKITETEAALATAREALAVETEQRAAVLADGEARRQAARDQRVQAQTERDRITAAHTKAMGAYEAQVKFYKTQRDAVTRTIEELEAAEAKRHEEVDQAYRAQHGARDVERRALTKKRNEFTRVITELTDADEAAEQACRAATTAYDAADQRVEDLGEMVAAPTEATGPSIAELETQLITVQGELATHARRAAAQAELERLVAEANAAEAKRIVYARLADALARVRAEELSHAGGPLAERMHKFLVGAGRSETPYILADKQICQIGWQKPGGDRVTIDALSKGECALYSAALADAVAAIRKPQVSMLICEAAELDDDTVLQLLAGVEAVRDAGYCLVLTSHAPPRIPAGWPTLRLEPERERAAAA